VTCDRRPSDCSPVRTCDVESALAVMICRADARNASLPCGLPRGEAMVLHLRETRDRKEHQPAKSELKARADWEEQRQKWPSLYDRDRQHWRTWDHFPSGRLSLTLTDPLRSQWQSGHLLGRWRDQKARTLETYLNDVLVGMITGAAVVRLNRIAAEVAERKRQQEHEAYLIEQERMRYQARVDAFIEGKADELTRRRRF
jgi:hypothetical protein